MKCLALAPALALFIGGVLFVAVETWLAGKPTRNDITWTVVVAVGLGQLLAAIFPGTFLFVRSIKMR